MDTFDLLHCFIEKIFWIRPNKRRCGISGGLSLMIRSEWNIYTITSIVKMVGFWKIVPKLLDESGGSRSNRRIVWKVWWIKKRFYIFFSNCECPTWLLGSSKLFACRISINTGSVWHRSVQIRWYYYRNGSNLGGIKCKCLFDEGWNVMPWSLVG